jgi:hypothetical protein
MPTPVSTRRRRCDTTRLRAADDDAGEPMLRYILQRSGDAGQVTNEAVEYGDVGTTGLAAPSGDPDDRRRIFRLYRKCVDQIPQHNSDSPPFAFHWGYRFANDTDWVLVCTVYSALGKRLHEGSYIRITVFRSIDRARRRAPGRDY